MENDPVPSAEEQAFLAHIIDDPADDLRRLVFADWLEENGQGQRATYIRVRCALDGKRPEFGTYADAIEQLAACRYQVPEVELPLDFFIRWHQGDRKDWWDDSEDTMEGGMPSVACVGLEAVAGVTPARHLASRLQALVETTPIRGLKISDNLPTYVAALFASPAASAITRLELRSSHRGGTACPSVVALAASPMARTLTRLDLDSSVLNQATADTLAAAPFVALRRFDARHRCKTPEVYRRVMAAPWFGRLERLVTPVPPGTVGRVALPHLHTLGIWSRADGPIGALGPSAELPALRRLTYGGGDLRGDRATALSALRCGDLVELELRNTGVGPSELRVLLAAPWARRLEVLTVDEYGPAVLFDEVIDKSPCEKTLRIRRFGDFN